MKIYVTFGQIHIHKINGKVFDKDCVAVINCRDKEHGQQLVQEYFGHTYCFTYYDLSNVGVAKYYPRGLITAN